MVKEKNSEINELKLKLDSMVNPITGEMGFEDHPPPKQQRPPQQKKPEPEKVAAPPPAKKIVES